MCVSVFPLIPLHYSSVHLSGTVFGDTGGGSHSISSFQRCSTVFHLLSPSHPDGRFPFSVSPNASRVSTTCVCSMRVFSCFLSTSPCIFFSPLFPSLLFTYQKWFLGVLVLSLALSVKMNILLFFPSLLLLLFEVSLLSSSPLVCRRSLRASPPRPRRSRPTPPRTPLPRRQRFRLPLARLRVRSRLHLQVDRQLQVPALRGILSPPSCRRCS